MSSCSVCRCSHKTKYGQGSMEVSPLFPACNTREQFTFVTYRKKFSCEVLNTYSRDVSRSWIMLFTRPRQSQWLRPQDSPRVKTPGQSQDAHPKTVTGFTSQDCHRIHIPGQSQGSHPRTVPGLRPQDSPRVKTPGQSQDADPRIVPGFRSQDCPGT